MTLKGTAARIHLTTRLTPPILRPQAREPFDGKWGRYEYSFADFDWDPHRDATRHCNDEVRPNARSVHARPDDLECRINILKNAVWRMELAISDSLVA
jgi:hypothetical protein